MVGLVSGEVILVLTQRADARASAPLQTPREMIREDFNSLGRGNATDRSLLIRIDPILEGCHAP